MTQTALDLFPTEEAPPLIVHALVEATSDKGKRVYRAKCGIVFETKERTMPPQITAWGSQITCPPCQPQLKEANYA